MYLSVCCLSGRMELGLGWACLYKFIQRVRLLTGFIRKECPLTQAFMRCSKCGAFKDVLDVTPTFNIGVRLRYILRGLGGFVENKGGEEFSYEKYWSWIKESSSDFWSSLQYEHEQILPHFLWPPPSLNISLHRYKECIKHDSYLPKKKYIIYSGSKVL